MVVGVYRHVVVVSGVGARAREAADEIAAGRLHAHAGAHGPEILTLGVGVWAAEGQLLLISGIHSQLGFWGLEVGVLTVHVLVELYFFLVKVFIFFCDLVFVILIPEICHVRVSAHRLVFMDHKIWNVLF